MNRKFFGIILSFFVLVSFLSITSIANALDTIDINSISPSSAFVGDTVIINGNNLDLTTGVFFGQVNAAEFYTILSTTQISVVVPSGAKTGNVTLETKDGIFSNPSNFTVKPEPAVAIYPRDVKSTSVTFLILEGLQKDKSYNFSLYLKNNTDSTFKLVETKPVVGNSFGGASVSFIDLLPGSSYKGEIKAYLKTFTSNFTTLQSDNDLNGIIAIVNQRLEDPSITEGTKVGEYKVGSKAILQSELDYAKGLMVGISDHSQADINNAARDLRAALDTFELSKITTATTGAGQGSTDSDLALIENGGIVPRCNVGAIDKVTGQYKVPCNFNYFIDLINRVIKFLLFIVATPLIALIIMYTGYLYITAGGNSGQVEKVKHILFNAVIGYVIALAAWLIVNTIVTSLNVDPSINTFMDKIQK